jgi:putative endonuclease
VKDGFEHKYRVYIIASATGTLYTAMTGDLFVRIMQHKAGEIEGFAKTSGCKRLVRFDNVHNAINREKQIKSWRREKKIALIEKTNPRWQDMAEHWGSELRLLRQNIGKTP